MTVNAAGYTITLHPEITSKYIHFLATQSGFTGKAFVESGLEQSNSFSFYMFSEPTILCVYLGHLRKSQVIADGDTKLTVCCKYKANDLIHNITNIRTKTC